jgi:hypothetical protein
MVTDEDDDRAFFARNVVQCLSLAIGGRKPELRRRRVKNALGNCCPISHLLVPKYMLTTACRGTCFQKSCSRVASRQPFPVYALTGDVERSVGVGRSRANSRHRVGLAVSG